MSALDERIRHLAREEFSGRFTNADAEGTGPVSALAKEIAELRDRVEKLENAAPAPAAKRTARKAAPEPGE